MPIDFPNSPTLNQEFTSNGFTWKWNGTAWDIVSGGSAFRVSSAAPTSPAVGDLWYDEDSGEVYIYYDSQWVAPVVPATIPTASAGTIDGISNSEGTSTNFSRADHTHAISLPAVSAYRLNQTLSHNTTTVINFNQENFDTSGFHNNSINSSRITIPTGLGGLYLIVAILSFDGNTTGLRQTRIMKNGSTQLESVIIAPTPNSNTATVVQATTIRQLSESDYIEVQGRHFAGVSLNMFEGTFSAVRIS